MDKQLLIAFNQKFQDFLATYAQLEKNQHVIKGAIPSLSIQQKCIPLLVLLKISLSIWSACQKCEESLVVL